MSTPYEDDLALISNNNEGISEVFSFTTDVDGVEVPVDWTGYTFFAQARVAKNKTSELICQINVEIYGDPKEGKILFTVSDDVMKNIEPVRGHYDVLVRSASGGNTDSLYMAPFRVGGGVTDVSQWL